MYQPETCCGILTGCLTSFQLMPLFWKVVAALETTVKLSVLAAVIDDNAFQTWWQTTRWVGVQNTKSLLPGADDLLLRRRTSSDEDCQELSV